MFSTNKYFEEIISTEIIVTKDGEEVEDLNTVTVDGGGESSDVEEIDRDLGTEEKVSTDVTEMIYPAIKLKKKLEDTTTEVSKESEENIKENISDDENDPKKEEDFFDADIEVPDESDAPAIHHLYQRYKTLKDEPLPTGGLEAIRFSFNSTLVKRLDDLFSKCLEIAKDVELTYLLNNKRALPQVDRLARMTKEGLEKIFKEECGIIITEYVRAELAIPYFDSGHPTGMFGVYLDFVNPDVLEQQLGRYSLSKTDPEDIERYKALESVWDEDSAKMTSSFTDSGKGKGYVNVRFIFDHICAYFLEHFNVADKDRSGLTAEEITAIVLHEIGHVNTLVERASKTLYLAKQFNEDRTILSKQMTYPEMNSKLSDLKNKAKSLNNKQLEKAIEVSKTAIERLRDLSEDKTTTIGRLFASLLLSSLELGRTIITMMQALTVRCTFTGTLVDTGIYMIAIIKRKMARVTGIKTSDVIGTFNNDTQMERWADEFAVRHGRGDALTSGLGKLIVYLKSCPSFTMTSYNSFYFSKLANLLSMTLFSAVNILTYNYPPLTYDEDSVRLRKIKEDCQAIFKDKDLPGFIRDHALIQVEKADKAYIEFTKKKFNPAVKILSFIANITSLNVMALYRLVSSIEDYEKLFNSLNSLDNNSLYYLSSLLEKANEEAK